MFCFLPENKLEMLEYELLISWAPVQQPLWSKGRQAKNKNLKKKKSVLAFDSHEQS